MQKLKWIGAVAFAVVLTPSMVMAQPQNTSTMDRGTSPSMKQGKMAAMPAADRASVDKITAGWPERPRLGANEMMAKYGMPQEATSERLIWHNAGPFKRIMVLKMEAPHDFPLPHMDYLEHTITYNVPQDKVGDLIAFDASSTINRTVGELSARCDLEGHNVLTLNLDHDIVTGKKTVEEAREAFGKIVAQDVKGEHPPYVEKLQFEPAEMADAVFTDKPVIPGSPVRADAKGTSTNEENAADAEVLACLVAVDMNEVLAAAAAGKMKMSQPAIDYAKMLHEAHGKHMTETMKLGMEIDVTPVITKEVAAKQIKGAGELAALVVLEGEAFEKAYIAAMVKGHTEVLEMIDGKLIPATKNDKLKEHVTMTREHIAKHLEKAKALQK